MRTAFHRGLRAAACCVAALAPAAATADPMAGDVRLTYAVYVHNLRAMTLDADVAVSGDHYVATTATHPAGLLGGFVTNRVTSRAEGTISNGAAHPSTYVSAGFSRGADRRTEIAWSDGRPEVRVLSPVEPNRDQVAAGRTGGAVDGLSAMAALLDDFWATGRCDGHALMFDGARLSDISSRTAGTTTLPQSDRSPYAGPVVECAFSSQQIAGFLHDQNFEASRQPHLGRAWLRDVVPGVGPVPVRIEFASIDHGEIDLFLTAARK